MATQILRIGADRTTLGAGALAIGWSTIAREFRRDQPSPLELENAIAAIEDEIARPYPRITGSRPPSSSCGNSCTTCKSPRSRS